jgi:hypothetical protein
MKLPNPRSFVIIIIGEENKIGLALEDNTSMIVCIYRYSSTMEWGFSTLLYYKIVETNFQERSLLQL